MVTNESTESCILEDLNAQETEERIPAIIFLSVSMVIGIFGNSLVLVVYFGSLRRRLRAHWIFIRALAITDFLVCVIVIPFELFQQTHQLTFYNEGSCKFFRSLTVYSTIISAFLMVAVSSDRLRLVCWPTSAQLSPKQALIIIIVIACGSIVFSWPEGVLSGISLEHLECNLTGYDCSFSDRSSEHTTTYSAVLFSVFIICMFALVIMYSIIAYQVLRRTNQTLKKITKIAVVISLCFISSYIPYSVIKLNGAIKKGIFTNRLPDGLFPILARMFVINNIVNPIVYGFLDSTFREHVALLCNIMETEEQLWLARISTDSDFAIFKTIHKHIQPHRAWRIARDCHELRLSAKYVVDLCAVTRYEESPLLCDKCGRFYYNVIEHIICACDKLYEVRERLWEELVNIEPIEFSFYLDSMTPDIVTSTLLACDTDYELDRSNSNYFAKTCVIYIHV